jgi:rare lipoprotein A
MNQLTCAHPSLPFGTRVRITNLSNGKQVVVTVNDRGPYSGGRIVDVSYRAAKVLGFVSAGTADVKLEALGE